MGLIIDSKKLKIEIEYLIAYPVDTSILIKTYSPDVAMPRSFAASIISRTVSGLAHNIITEIKNLSIDPNKLCPKFKYFTFIIIQI